MEIQFPELLLDLDIFLTPGNSFLHPFGLGKGVLLSADLDGVGSAGFKVLDEVGESRGFGG